MCRFALYMGPAITLDRLTTRPVHSIIQQSWDARMREPLNGDGFGVAWYVPELSDEPAVFRSIRPAWNNVNLRHLARVTRSSVILAHVRAATEGLAVMETNCHPFVAGPLAFMHNGVVIDFQRLKRPLQQRLSDEAFSGIAGTTDSEHLFALFQDRLAEMDGPDPTHAMADALTATITVVADHTRAISRDARSTVNVAVSDGARAVVSRWGTGEAPPPSLFYHTGDEFTCTDGLCHMTQTEQPHRAVVVASEPLTEEPDWKPVPENHLLLIHPDRSLEFRDLGARGISNIESGNFE